MERFAQSSLEYLMTYGWGLVLIATIIGALVFVIGVPSDVAFNSSDPTKIMLFSGNVSGSRAEIKLRNITGGTITITSVSLSAPFSGGKLNGVNTADITASNPVKVGAGQEIHLTDLGYSGIGSGGVTIGYTDITGLDRTVTITAGGGGRQTATLIESCPYTIDSPGDYGGRYMLAGNLNTTGSCITISTDNIELNCRNNTITGNNSGTGILMMNAQNAVVENCTINDFYYGINIGDGGSPVSVTATISGNTLNSNYVGLTLYWNTLGPVTINNNTVNNNGDDGIRVIESTSVNLSGNTANLNGSQGFYIHDTPATLNNNTTEQNSQEGVTITSTASATVNNHRSCDNAGLDIFCSDVEVSGTGNTIDPADCLNNCDVDLVCFPCS